MEVLFVAGIVIRRWRRLPLQHLHGNGDQEQRTVLIRHLGKQGLRHQFEFDVGMGRIVVMMIGVPAQILEMHQISRFLPVEADMIVDMSGTAQHQQKQGCVQQARHVAELAHGLVCVGRRQ